VTLAKTVVRSLTPAARSFRADVRRFGHVINKDGVLGTHNLGELDIRLTTGNKDSLNRGKPFYIAWLWRLRAAGLSLKFAIRVARVTSSAARMFCFRYKTGMSRLFRTHPAPLSQCAMM
jgi:hypothetical protein